MEIPNEIYLEVLSHSEPKEVCKDVIKLKRTLEDDIEYVSTDTFIEKACKWLKESITNNPECNRIISKNGVITMGLLIDDFKNYMKGE